MRHCDLAPTITCDAVKVNKKGEKTPAGVTNPRLVFEVAQGVAMDVFCARLLAPRPNIWYNTNRCQPTGWGRCDAGDVPRLK